jgi:hypothetical protein
VRLALVVALALGASACLEAKPGPAVSHLPDGGFGPDPAACPEGGASDGGEDASDDAGADAGSGVAGFVGTWTFTSGGMGVACPDGLSNSQSMGGLVIKEAPQGGSLVVTEDACTFHFTVVGDTATSDCGQACSAWAIPTIPSWTLTLKADGTLEERLGGRVPLNGEVCTISGSSKLTRSAQ